MSTRTLESRAWSCGTMVDGADASRVIKDLNLRGTDLSTALKDWGLAM